MTHAHPETRAGELELSLTDQLDWAVTSLGLSRVDRPGRIRIEPGPEAMLAESLAGPQEVRGSGALLQRDSQGGTSPPPPGAAPTAEVSPLITELAEENGAVLEWLREARQAQQQSASGAWEAEPAGEPTTIREIASPLLSPFSVRQGHTRLAGCTLEQQPLLRLCRLAEDFTAADQAVPRVQWRYYGTDGRPCAEATGPAQSTGPTEATGPAQSTAAADGAARGELTCPRPDFDRLQTLPFRLRADERESIDEWVAAVAENDPGLNLGELLDVTVVWCRWASGKIIIQFDSGPSTAISFAGRARDYAAGGLRPPPFRCSRSGLESYEIIALEDGTITVPAAVARCQLTGRELLLESLAVCEATGMRVERQRLVRCEATGGLALPDRLLRCDWCDRRLLPNQIQEGRCVQCRDAGPIQPDDPQLTALRSRHPQELARLGSGRRWYGWIGGSVGVLIGGGMFAHRMLVFEPASGAVFRRGTRARLSRRWTLEGLD